MRTKKEILTDEKLLIKVGVKTLPIHTELLLDIRELLIKLNKRTNKIQNE